MKTQNILIIGILLAFVTYSCLDEYHHPDLTTEASEIFGADDARKFFEEKGTGMSALRSFDGMSTRAAITTEQLLIPEWNKAMASQNSYVKLIEVPVRAASMNICFSKTVTEGKVERRMRTYTERRLLIAKPSNGETEMFVITIIPTTPQAQKNINNFRFLGGGDFTGHVFCSTLDGIFIKAFGYINGRNNGWLSVVRKTEWEQHNHHEAGQSYVLVGLGEVPLVGTRSEETTTTEIEYTTDSTETIAVETDSTAIESDTTTTTDTETTIDSGSSTETSTTTTDEDHCAHGFPWGECPSGTCLEVVVTVCPDCGTQDGCTCGETPSYGGGYSGAFIWYGGYGGGGSSGGEGDSGEGVGVVGGGGGGSSGSSDFLDKIYHSFFTDDNR